MPNCKKCDDTGVIETGNNDLPCDCPAGAIALFNVAGSGRPQTGAELRELDAIWKRHTTDREDS
jgi:hypothetical protein